MRSAFSTPRSSARAASPPWASRYGSSTTSLADLPPGAVGEIAVRSPSVMAGYWRKPEATAEVMRGDWYLTGDLGYTDEASYFYLVDRAKDMIVSGGENIYSTEVEDALATHPCGRGGGRLRRSRPALG